MRVVVHGHLGFIHGFQQCRLRLRRGAVDFVRQNDVGENRAGLEIESLLDLIEDAGAYHIGGQQVRSKLDPLERAMKGIRQRLRQRRLAHARNIFDEEVALCQQRHDRQAYDFVLSANDTRNRTLQLRDLVGWWLWSWVENTGRFCYKLRVRAILVARQSKVRAILVARQSKVRAILIARRKNVRSMGD